MNRLAGVRNPAAGIEDGATGNPRTPHVILVAASLEGGGAERVMSDMANYWVARGWRVMIATWSGPEIEDFYALAPAVTRAWLDVHSPNSSFFTMARANLARVFRLRRLLRASRPDVVLSFIQISNVLTIAAACGLPLRVVVSERGCAGNAGEGSLSFYWRLLRKLLYAQSDAVTALNAEAVEWLRRKCRVDATVIPPAALRPLPEMTVAREPLILGVGRLHVAKGFDLLIRAYAGLTAAFPTWRLTLIGKGPERSALIGLCAELDLRHRVEFLEPMHDVERWMARAGVVVLPSRFEAFGNAVLESMAMGAAVISTNCPGPASLIDDGVNGRLVPVEDSDNLARVMAELMSQPEIRAKLGCEAMKVRERFAQDRIMQQWAATLLPDLVVREPVVDSNK
jgi:glycosyltransferase involved in cell wall biosynthesis